MSNDAMNWAREQTGLSSTQKFVLWIICDYYNDEKRQAWPSYSTIARDASLDASTVKRAVKHLESLGLIERQTTFAGAGQQTSNRYRLPAYELLPRSAKRGWRSATPRVAESYPGGGGMYPPGVAERAPNPSEPLDDPNEEPSKAHSKANEHEGAWNDSLDAGLGESAGAGLRRATQAQLSYLRDCFILQERELPSDAAMVQWAGYSVAEASEQIRWRWSDIEHEQSAGTLSEIEETWLWPELSERAREHVRKQAGMDSAPLSSLSLLAVSGRESWITS